MARRKTSRSSLAAALSPDFFRALADPNRVNILSRLVRAKRPQTVSDLAQRSPIDFSVVSRHLKILHAAGIVKAEKRGRRVLYGVRIPHFVTHLRDLADALQACSPECARTPSRNTTPSKGGSKP